MKKLVQLKDKNNNNYDPINLNYEKRIKKLEDNAYSTEETKIGTWIDGKPIYRKVISCGVLPNTEIIGTQHNIDNIDFITNYYGIAYRDTDGVSFKLPYISFPIENSVSVYVNKEVIAITTVSDRSTITQSYIVIEYTKTTD